MFWTNLIVRVALGALALGAVGCAAEVEEEWQALDNELATDREIASKSQALSYGCPDSLVVPVIGDGAYPAQARAIAGLTGAGWSAPL